VKKTTLPTLMIRSWILPICFTNEAANAFSVSVLVSVGEFANCSSITFTRRTASSGFAMRMTYQPTTPFVNVFRSSK